jgi:hypothetical protein
VHRPLFSLFPTFPCFLLLFISVYRNPTAAVPTKSFCLFKFLPLISGKFVSVTHKISFPQSIKKLGSFSISFDRRCPPENATV